MQDSLGVECTCHGSPTIECSLGDDLVGPQGTTTPCEVPAVAVWRFVLGRTAGVSERALASSRPCGVPVWSPTANATDRALVGRWYGARCGKIGTSGMFEQVVDNSFPLVSPRVASLFLEWQQGSEPVPLSLRLAPN